MSAIAGSVCSSRATRQLVVGALAAFAIATAGCGSSPSQSNAPGPPASPTLHQVLSLGAPVGPPPAEESITEARRRIGKTIASGDCKSINALYTLANIATKTDQDCSTLMTLGGSRPSGAASYGEQGGVLDYSTEDGPASIILVRDSDGLFRIAFVAAHESPATVKTPLAKGSDAIANAAVAAVRKEDCDGFLRVANREGGIGALPRAAACRKIASDPLQPGLFNSPRARPKRLGGNGVFAFYGLDTPSSYFTIVLARTGDSDSGPAQSSGGASSRYSYVASYRTNRPGAAPAR